MRCRHCQQDFDTSDKPKGWGANHSRWCNPERKPNPSNTDPVAIAKRRAGIKAAHQAGKYEATWIARTGLPGTPHSDEARRKISEKAKLSKHRRLLKSTREYTKKDGTIVMLDSSWEELLAKRLDKLDLRWERPKEPLVWIDQAGNNRNYFPDFYLIDHGIYLDPKNPYAYEQQREKIQWLKTNRQDVVFLLSEDEICDYSLVDKATLF